MADLTLFLWPGCGELSYDLLCNFHRWQFLNVAKLLPDALSVSFKFQVYVIHDTSLKFGIVNSECQMHCCIMDYFATVVFLYFLYFCICCE